MRIVALFLAVLLLGLAGCTKPDEGTGSGPTTSASAATTAPSSTQSSTSTTGGLVHNACTEHPKYGTGNPHVTLDTTMGDLVIEVYVDQVPNTGMNFVKLAEDGEFDGSPFHRIITNFMAQGGDYTMGNGRGGEAHPDCADGNGNIVDEYTPNLKHTGKGILSMANTGQLNSGSSQFFITFTATSWLDGYDANGNKKACGSSGVSCHAVFGKVTDGLAVLDKINSDAGSSNGTPKTPVTLEHATVTWP